MIDDPKGVLKVNDKLRLVPGHCDPTCNVHDCKVGVRNGKVEDGLAGVGTRQGVLRTYLRSATGRSGVILEESIHDHRTGSV